MTRAIALTAALLAGCAHYEIVGYYAGWKDPIAFDARDVTVVNYAFVDFAFRDESPALARLVAKKQENPRLKLMASIGGWTGSKPFPAVVATPTSRAAFIDAGLAFLRRTQFDGVDLDWEYPASAEDKRNFVSLAREMRAAFGSRYLLTIAAEADGDSSWVVDMIASLDWVNLMTYDYHGSLELTSGLNAPMRADPRDAKGASAAASIDRLIAAGIPRDKLTLGMPFYAKGWTGCAAGPRGDGLYQPCQAAVDDLDIRGQAGVRHWNEPGRVPYLYNPETRTLVTYDDERSIREKSRFVKERGLRGAMFWELGADRDGTLRRVVASELPH